MDESEIYAAIYKDALTGINNRKAFDESEYSTVAIIDLDSLKWLNDNCGHKIGDVYLMKVARTLEKVFGEDQVFRFAGDEFAVIGASEKTLVTGLKQAYRALPVFTAGIGITLAQADDELIANKADREVTGERASRGERPPWFKDVAIS